MTFLVPQSSTAPDAGADTEAAGRLAEQAFEASIGALELGAIYLGDRLGLYAASAGRARTAACASAARTRPTTRSPGPTTS